MALIIFLPLAVPFTALLALLWWRRRAQRRAITVWRHQRSSARGRGRSTRVAIHEAEAEAEAEATRLESTGRA